LSWRADSLLWVNAAGSLKMSTAIDLKNTHTLKVDTLKKTGEQYALVSLSAGNIDAILALQDVIFSSLSAMEQSFLLRKSRKFFKKHFAAGNIVLGIVHNGQLVAQSVIVHPTAQNPKTGMVDMALDAKPEEVTIIQGVVVHPAYQGNRLMTAMVDAWLEIAEKQGRTHAIAEVAVGNYYSWSIFLKEGLHIHSLGVDPADGTQLYNIHARVAPLLKRRLTPDFNKASAKDSVKCLQADFEAQKKLLSSGHKGVKFDPASGTIEFTPPKKPHKPSNPKRLP
jgi:RimJ/RimL family protein N-acetyltransferase